MSSKEIQEQENVQLVKKEEKQDKSEQSKPRDIDKLNNNNEGVRVYIPQQLFDRWDDILKDAATLGDTRYDTIEDIAKSHNTERDRLCERIYRLSVFLIGSIILIIMMIYLPMDWHVTQILSIGLSSVFITYFCHIYWIIFSGNHAYRVFTLNGNIDDWIDMPVAHAQIQYKHHPITSISELSAIGGSVTNQLLVIISVIAWTTIVNQTLNNIWYEKLMFNYGKTILCSTCTHSNYALIFNGKNLDTLAEFIGTFGLLVISTNELNPASSILRTLHTIGVFLGFNCVIGLFIQQWYIHKKHINTGGNIVGIILSISIGVIAGVFFVLWTYYKTHQPDVRDMSAEDAKKEVRKYSRRNIILESVVLISGAASLCLWLGFYDSFYVVYDVNNVNAKPFGPLNNFMNQILGRFGCNPQFITPDVSDTNLYCPAS